MANVNPKPISKDLLALKPALDTIEPIVIEFMDMLKAKPFQTTKHHYGDVMSMLGQLDKNMGKLFLISMVLHGYDQQTASQLKNIMGY